jgi:hypothetical protein
VLTSPSKRPAWSNSTRAGVSGNEARNREGEGRAVVLAWGVLRLLLERLQEASIGAEQMIDTGGNGQDAALVMVVDVEDRLHTLAVRQRGNDSVVVGEAGNLAEEDA